MTTATTTFKAGSIYSCRSACDHNCVWSFRVIRRTAKSVWIAPVRRGEVLADEMTRKAVTVSHYDDTEIVYPLGKYSMAPVLGADNCCD